MANVFNLQWSEVTLKHRDMDFRNTMFLQAKDISLLKHNLQTHFLSQTKYIAMKEIILSWFNIFLRDLVSHQTPSDYILDSLSDIQITCTHKQSSIIKYSFIDVNTYGREIWGLGIDARFSLYFWMISWIKFNTNRNTTFY